MVRLIVEVVELVEKLDSGAGWGNPVKVRVLFSKLVQSLIFIGEI